MLGALAACWALVAAPAPAQSPPAPQDLPQDPPLLDPFESPWNPWEAPDVRRPWRVGIWPIDKLHEVAIDWYGSERTDAAIRKGLESLQKNLYRKLYIEEGLFLIQLPPADDPNPRDDHMFFIPADPSKEPLVIFMKDLHRLQENGKGSLDEILRAILSGDRDLVKLAGRTLFDTRFTVQEWTFVLGEKGLGGAGTDGGRRPYYYRFRQNGLTRLKVEGGVGHAWQLGDAPYYVGGSLGAESYARYRSRDFQKDAVGRAKIGVWGKVPFVPRTSFGLSAMQGWHAEDGIFETELRAGLFHGSGPSGLGLLAWRRIAGEKYLSAESRSLGAQVFYTPDQTVNVFLSLERVQSSEGDSDEKLFLLGVDFLAGRSVDPSAWARSIVGPGAGEADLEAFYGLAARGASFLEGGAGGAEELLALLRREELAATADVVLRLPGGLYLGLSSGEVLEAARAIERWEFGHAPRGADPAVPGWAPHEVGPRRGEDVIRELLGRVPKEDLRAALDFGESGLEGRLEAAVLIHASAIRRAVDARVAGALMFLGTAAQKAMENPYLRVNPSGDVQARLIWARLAGARRERVADASGHVRRAAAWLRRENADEGERLGARLAAYGRGRLERLRVAPGWPAGLDVRLSDPAWAALLAGYGEDFVAAVLSALRQRAGSLQPRPLTVEIGYSPFPGASARLRRSEGSWYLELGPPRPGASRAETLLRVLELIRS